jgi:hypothetical protein
MEEIVNANVFRPRASALKWWAMMPQIALDVNGKNIPPLFGSVKSVAIHIMLVLILIVAEIILIIQLNEDGTPPLVLFILSLADFVVAILPPIIKFSADRIPSLLKTQKFIAEYKIEIYNRNKGRGDDDLLQDAQKALTDANSKLSMNKIIGIIFILIIVSLNIWKLLSIYNVYGDDIFIIGLGRMVIIVILMSIFIHLYATSIVMTYILYRSALGKQSNGYETMRKYNVEDTETNVEKEFEYEAIYRPASSTNLRIVQRAEIPENNSAANNGIMELVHDGKKMYYKTNNFDNDKKSSVVYTGLISEAEISDLINRQDNKSKMPIVVTCKEIQLNQFDRNQL